MKFEVGLVTGLFFTFDFFHGECMGKYVVSNKDNYRFRMKIGECYEVYHQDEKVTPTICQRPLNPEKQSCIYLITGEQYCLGLKTPTNETIQLLCANSEEELLNSHLNDDLNNCFNVSLPDQSYKEICQQIFDKYSLGVTTPDNFTILFDSYFCATSVSDEEREKFNNFTITFSFDSEIERCYKIYDEHQDISPYTCLSEEGFTACAEKLPHVKNCEGIITQNNESVILHCSDGSGTLQNRSCFKIYTADNTLHIACQEKVEERCIGIRTPSNLTVLLECYFCTQPGVIQNHDVEKLRKHGKFFTTYFSNEYLGKNLYLDKFELNTLDPNINLDFRMPIEEFVSLTYGYWLPNTTCYAITLPSNETVILECTSSNDRFKHFKRGCFPVVDTKIEVEQVVCIKILDEECIGIVTPMNWTVELACYQRIIEHGWKDYAASPYTYSKNVYRDRSVNRFRLDFALNECYEFYPPEEVNAYSCTKSANPESYSCIHWISGEKQCLGLKTPNNETIELACAESDEKSDSYTIHTSLKNCFNVFGSNNQLEKACLEKFDDYSIGLVTSSNYSILFDSFFCPAQKSPQQIQEYKEFIDSFVFDSSIRSCYKVYTPDQDVSPYTCLNYDVYDPCIHQIENTNCMGITTQNNETIVLECWNDTPPAGKNCFSIYTSDNEVYSACQKQIEERCVGIVTPSNLTVLLECQTCLSTKGGLGLPDYNDEDRSSYRESVEYYLYELSQDDYASKIWSSLKGYTPERDIMMHDCYGEIGTYILHELPGHENCQGITLENLETIVLSCPNKVPEKPGCFDIFSPVYGENREIIGPEIKTANVCVKILNEWCVGIRTPENWTVPINCWGPSSLVCSAFVVPHNGPPPKE